MAKVVSMKPAEYSIFLPGTRFFDAAANKSALDPAQPASLQAVAPAIASFLLEHKLIDGKPDAARGVDASLLADALK
jgi:NitT/TauT family transport system substrate-binding protein